MDPSQRTAVRNLLLERAHAAKALNQSDFLHFGKLEMSLAVG